MTFDPFGDFVTQGYLRNVEKEKDLDIVKRLEHASFTTGLDEAFTALGNPENFLTRTFSRRTATFSMPSIHGRDKIAS